MSASNKAFVLGVSVGLVAYYVYNSSKNKG